MYSDRYNYREYACTREEILKRKTFPFVINNEEFADYCFAKFQAEFTTARLIKYAGNQYICFDDRAARKVYKQLSEELHKLTQKGKELREFIDAEFQSNIEQGGISYGKKNYF